LHKPAQLFNVEQAFIFNIGSLTLIHVPPHRTAIEQLTIEKLEALGYQYLYGLAIAVDGDAPERQSYQQVILPERVKAAIRRKLLIIWPLAVLI